MRRGMIVTAVFAVGAVLGWAVVPGPGNQEEDPQVVTVMDMAKIEELEEQIAFLESRGDDLVSENYDLMALISDLTEAQAALSVKVSEALEETEEEQISNPEQEAAIAEARERRRQQAQEWAGRFERQTREMFEEQIALMDDPLAAERLDALMEWREYQRELGREMRGAESEEERAALMGEMRDARANAQQVLDDQQDSLLRSFAKGQGIEGEDLQSQFTAQLREVLQNPFFEMERTLVGGGPMGGMGRRAGGSRRQPGGTG